MTPSSPSTDSTGKSLCFRCRATGPLGSVAQVSRSSKGHIGRGSRRRGLFRGGSHWFVSSCANVTTLFLPESASSNRNLLTGAAGLAPERAGRARMGGSRPLHTP